jgi:HKD family nuclease
MPALALFAMALLNPTPAQAQSSFERLCDPQFEDCRTPLVTLIDAETQGIDVAFWFMYDARYSNAIVNRFRAGVPVRVLMDDRADETKPNNGPIVAQLRDAGIPMRKKSGGGILHWKAMIFHGQSRIEFSAANYQDIAFVPNPANVNWIDEAVYFSDDPALKDTFTTQFETMWIDTTGYADYANVTSPPTRRFPVYPLVSYMNFVPYQDYANRSTSRYSRENQRIDVVMYRVTDERHTNKMVDAVGRGVPVRLITEPDQYRDTHYLWHSYNIDRMYAAGVQIKERTHQGLMHQKSVILFGLGEVIFGSSNWTSASAGSKAEHNLFYNPTVGKPWFFQWFVDQFERKWSDAAGFRTFTPLPPATPVNLAPATGALGIGTSVTLRWEGGTWAHRYDIYFGTDPNPPLLASNVATGSPVNGTSETYTIPNLVPGTVYYWKVTGKTMASLGRTGPVWSFTTTGGGTAPAAPSGVLATGTGPSQIRVDWADLPDETQYFVERSPNGSSGWTQLAVLAGNVTSFGDNNGLAVNTSYFYRVRAGNLNGYSPYSAVVQGRTLSGLSPGDVVLYASEATRFGDWEVLNDTTAVGGRRLHQPDRGRAKLTAALAAPANYVELSFNATAGVPYRAWFRMKADNNSYQNDSVYVQFDGSVNAGGTPMWRTGTADSTWIGLEECSGCGLAGWGWHDNGYGVGVRGPVVYFAATGPQTIRIQQREDGISIDQIVISSDSFVSASPGVTKNDTTQLPQSDGSVGPPPDGSHDEIVLRAIDVAAADTVGRWTRVSDATAADGIRLWNQNAGAAKIEAALAAPSDYFTVEFDADAGKSYHLWLRLKADANSYSNDSVYAQFDQAVNVGGTPIWRIGTTDAAAVTLEDRSGAGVSGWGWNDNGWASLGPAFQFATSGRQRLLVQVREDGASIDQIVISAATYLTASPGALKNDTLVVPR